MSKEAQVYVEQLRLYRRRRFRGCTIHTAVCYEGANIIDDGDQYLLDHSIEEIETWTGAKKKIWLRSIEAAKNLKRKRVEEDAENRQTLHKRRRRQHNASQVSRPRTISRKRHHDMNTTGQKKKVRKRS